MASINLEEKVQALERRCDASDKLINELEKKNRELRMREALRQSSVFSVRLTTDKDLAKDKGKFVRINKCIIAYRASPIFDASICRLTAPVNGHYYLDMGMRQNDKKGSLEIALFLGSGSSSTPVYIGQTTGPNTVCHKTMVVTLNKGDTVHARVKRLGGRAEVLWCAFHGYLISATDDGYLAERTTPSAPPARVNFNAL